MLKNCNKLGCFASGFLPLGLLRRPDTGILGLIVVQLEAGLGPVELVLELDVGGLVFFVEKYGDLISVLKFTTFYFELS